MRLIDRCIVALLAVASMAGAAHATELGTTFESNNWLSGNMFDVVTLGNDLTVSGFNLNISPGTVTIAVYEKAGTWVGSENSASAWTLIDSHVVTSVAGNAPTFFDVKDFVLVGASTTGLYITTTEPQTYLNYTNGSAVGSIAAANADLQILQGSGNEYAFGYIFQPRIWNGSIIYTVNVVPEPGSYAMLLAGLAGIGALVRRRRRV